jgi:hypothetical protein
LIVLARLGWILPDLAQFGFGLDSLLLKDEGFCLTDVRQALEGTED